MTEENFTSIIHSYEIMFRVIDTKLGKGFFTSCYDIVDKMIKQEVINQLDKKQHNKFYEIIYDGVSFLHRKSPDDGDGGILPTHYIPQRLEDEFDKLKRFYK